MTGSHSFALQAALDTHHAPRQPSDRTNRSPHITLRMRTCPVIDGLLFTRTPCATCPRNVYCADIEQEDAQ